MKKFLLLLGIGSIILSGTIHSQETPVSAVTDQTIESLLKEVAKLEAQLDTIISRLPFQQMEVLTLVASEKNMNVKTENGLTTYGNVVRIDNPLCNNNPKAIVLATSYSVAKRIETINVFYDERDKFWYIRISDWMYKGFVPGIVIDANPVVIERINDDLPGTSKSVPEFKKLSDRPFEQTYGIGYAGPNLPGIGLKFSVVIFTELINPLRRIQPDEMPRTDKTNIEQDTLRVKVIDEPKKEPQMDAQFFPVSGEWQYKMTSAGGNVFSGKVFMVENGTVITGNIFTNDNTKTAISGNLVNNELNLRRVTGMQTTQIYKLNRISKSLFSGTYYNEGKYPDSGVIEFSR